MKLRYLFSTILASVLLFAGCVQESIDSFENIKLSKTYLAMPEEGGEVELTVTASQDWSFVESDVWPRVLAFKKDENGKQVIDEAKTTPSWLTLKGDMTGKAGETKVVFTAEASNGGREVEIAIKAGNNVQYFRVRQGSMVAADATCLDVINGVDGKSYRIEGVCTSIANDYYGNFYLNDGTGEVYVYGTKDADGQYNWSKFNIEVGDVVKVEGPRKNYNGTIELVNALFIEVTKSLVKVETESKVVEKEGGEFDVKVAFKGAGAFPSIPEEYRSWVSIADMSYIEGIPTKLEPNPADTAVVKIAVAANAGGDREACVVFASSSGKSSSSVDYKFTQKGAIIETNVKGFLAAAEDATQYRLKGVVSYISVNTTYHNASVDIVGGDGSEVSLYRLAAAEGNIEDLNIAVGDLITVVGARSSYNGKPQMAEAGKCEKVEKFEKKTVAEFLAAAEGDAIYAVTGEIVGINKLDGSYNNVELTVKDGNDEVLLYRVTTFDGTNVTEVGFKVGGTVTVAGKRSSYKGTPQMAAGGICLNYTAPVEGGDETPAGQKEETISGTFTYDETAKTLSLTTASGITITQSLVEGTTAVNQTYNTATTLRVYKGHALTFSGKTITKIVLNHTSDRCGNSVTASTGTYTPGSTSSEWTGEANSVVITNTGAAENVQLRPTQIIVTYKE